MYSLKIHTMGVFKTANDILKRLVTIKAEESDKQCSVSHFITTQGWKKGTKKKQLMSRVARMETPSLKLCKIYEVESLSWKVG